MCVNPSVSILNILGSYLPICRIIGFRSDLAVVFNLEICDEPTLYLNIVRMRRHKVVQLYLALTYGTTDCCQRWDHISHPLQNRLAAVTSSLRIGRLRRLYTASILN